MRKTLATMTLLTTASVAVAGCSAPGGNEPTEEGETQVNLAFSNPTIFTTGLPYYVATAQGFYEEAGLSVDATFTGGGSETVQAVVSGSADIGTETSGAAAIGAYTSGAPIDIIAASTTGLDLQWFAEPDSGLENRADLAGKRMGYSSTGSSSHIGILALSELLEAEGLAPAQPESIGGPPDNLTAVQTDQIDAGWTQPPFFLDRVANGELVLVADGAEIGDYADVAMRVIIGNETWLEENPETATTFLEVHDRTWDWIFDNPEEAATIWKEAADLELSEEVLLTSFDYYDREELRIAPLDGRDVLLDDAVEFGFAEQPLTDEEVNDLFNLSYLPES
ncbi:ABC transporter substrate-binding protein [Blastococcus saxobsidens]|uniref:NitT/TauT family transport system substrate-binding protein n=1 Tax=Blastococcus saxobsidens TaxID=138336 RepID=A0A4Q7Y376_9ACTN|nr:ABC transporter substrate-binding protein [Blastococcus saxobsidens]RZU30834.1 NitT/TauT family transport system substrate-binding protein [Blastococcus saxobsidens]